MKVVAAVLAVVAGACSGPCPGGGATRTAAPRPEPATPAPVHVEPPAGPPLEMRPIESGWGSTGVVAANVPPPYWVVAVVELRALRDVEGLAVAGIDVVDAQGRVVGTATRELELRTVPEDRSPHDFSAYGTGPFDGRIRAGGSVRVSMHARLDDGFPGGPAAPVRYRARFRMGGELRVELEGPLGSEWPTG